MDYRGEVKEQWKNLSEEHDLPGLTVFEKTVYSDLRLPVLEKALSIIKSRLKSFEALIHGTLTKKNYFLKIEENFLSEKDKRDLKTKVKEMASSVSRIYAALHSADDEEKVKVLKESFEELRDKWNPYFKKYFTKVSEGWASHEDEKSPTHYFG